MKMRCKCNNILVKQIFLSFIVSSYCCLTRSIKDVDSNNDNEHYVSVVGNDNTKNRSGKFIRNVMDTTTVDDCDLLNCDNESDGDNVNVICAATNTGAIATFRSECGVKLLNCYQRLYTADQYQIISRKACARKSIWYLRGHCDSLLCDSNDQHPYYSKQQQLPPEKRVCATNGDSVALFKSACHVEVLNCYQKMYRKSSKKSF